MKNGILLVDKPAGWTSFDVLAKLRGALGTRRLGHSGTLDPMATGVLAVFIGTATAAADRQPEQDKTYVATLRLGVGTDTGDITGTVLQTADAAAVGREAFCAVLPRFTGVQQQLPPMYSAVKVHGQPLYKAARAGKTVERKPRPVTIHRIEYLGAGAPMQAPAAPGNPPPPDSGQAVRDYTIRVSCSKGTYIRTLAEDIGAALGVPATLCALRRTRAGVFGIEQAHTLPQILDAARAGRVEDWILPVETVFAPLPALRVNEFVCTHLKNGCPTSRYPAQDGLYRVYDEAACFLGLARVEAGVLRVDKLFCERS